MDKTVRLTHTSERPGLPLHETIWERNTRAPPVHPPVPQPFDGAVRTGVNEAARVYSKERNARGRRYTVANRERAFVPKLGDYVRVPSIRQYDVAM